MFFFNHSGVSLAVLGAVCLVRHRGRGALCRSRPFRRPPIRTAWLYLVFPALVINYFGQGALVLAHPDAAESPLFRLVPDWALLPMVILATLATIIASQAVITGAFSLTRQAVQLGLLPRLEIRFTSAAHQGQIYVPRVNMLLLIGVIMLVLIFQSSSNLSHAYGVSVFGAMSVDAVLAIIVIWKGWRWSLGLTLALMLPFLFIDLSFFGANLLKLFTGGYVPVILASRHHRDDVDLGERHHASCSRRPARSTCRSSSWCGCSKRARRIRSRERPCSSPAIPTPRPPPCCTTSSTTRCCTRRT